MTPWNDYLLTLIMQVSVISLVTLALTALNLSSAAKRHALGVLGLMLVLSSPLVTLLLPEMDWWRWAFLGSKESTIASRERERTPSMPVRLKSSIDEARAIHIEETETVAEPATQSPSLDNEVFVTPPSSSDAPLRLTAQADEVPHRGWLSRNWLVVLAGLVWITGSVVSAGLWIWQRRRLGRLARSLNLVDGSPLYGGQALDGASDNFPAIAREVCEAVGLRKLPPIALSQVMPMPLVLGIWRPTIVIPCELLRAGAETRLKDVLIHEAAHVARRDAWISVAQRLASVLWWWHPGVLVLNRTITRSREEVCDNFVLSRSDSSQYAHTLLELSEKCAQMGRMVPSLGLFESHWTLEARIRGMLKPGREMMTQTKRRALVVIIAILGTVCFLIGGVRAFDAENRSTEQSTKGEPPLAATKPSAEAASVTKLRRVVIRGQCIDDQAEPLAAARVLVVRRSKDYRSQVIVGETKSDAEGRYELRDVETAMLDQGDLFAVAALKGYVSACVPLANPKAATIEQELKLSSNPGTLSGVVSDSEGRPIPGVTVFLSCCVSDEPLPGILSSVTDENGRYAITDLKRWTPESTRTFDPTTGTGTMVTSCNFLLRHPDYPTSMAKHSAVPQEVNVTLYPPAIVEGRVIDAVTNQPAPNVTVSSQGVARRGWYQTRTDAQGRYRLRMTRDHYNIWAEADDRIAVAVKALRAERGQTASNADIRLVRGGFVVGTVSGADGKPISPTKESEVRVAHYGPARPRTGAAVTSTLVQPTGTYRLRVAPGRNHIYSMSGSGTSGYVSVEEGKEVKFDIHLGEKQRHQPEDEDQRLGRKILQAAEKEDAILDGSVPRTDSPQRASTSPNGSGLVSRKRPATRIGKLLDELAEQNASNDRFHDVWARTLKQIVGLGAESVPELIAELDATNDDMMLRCLGFTLRAIDDKRAIPALIRAIPKTLLPPGSDMGLRAEEESLAKFMQQHDLDGRDEGMEYGFGRPVREIFGALNKLTGKSFGEEQIYSVFASGNALQQQLKQQLFQRIAKEWADWWEQHWRDFLKDAAYSQVRLPESQSVAAAPVPINQQRRFKTSDGDSGWILGSYADPKTRHAFYDLDTGRAAGLPNRWRQTKDIKSHRDEIEAWAGREGFDLMGTEYVSPEDNDQRFYALRPVGLQAWELGEQRWKMSSSDITFEALRVEGNSAAGLLLRYDREKATFDPKETATFLFKTREGTPGLLFVGVEVQDDSLKPGGVGSGDDELEPIAFFKGRRFGWAALEELRREANP